MNFDIVDPTEYAGWDNLLLSTPGHSFFHASAWARVLKESYGYTPMYFASIENGQFSALVPVMEVNSFLTGKRGVSLPFTDYCEPIVKEDGDFVECLNNIIEYGKKRGWKYFELRGGERYFRNQESGARNQDKDRSQESGSRTQEKKLNPETLNLEPVSSSLSALCPLPSAGSPCPLPLAPRALPLTSMPYAPCFATYVGHTLDLTGGEGKILSGFRDSTRRNIKKAEKEGVTVKIFNSLESVKKFYRMNCLTRKKHGLPPQPYCFFRKVYDHIISRELGFVTLASHNGQNIAGAVFFYFGDKGIYKYGASDMKFQDLRANNLAMWEGIRWSCNNGYKTFCFGRTEPENKGLQQFKAGWGAEEQTISYFKYDLTRRVFVSNSVNPQLATRNTFLNQLAQRTPIPVLNLAGSLLYRHMG